MSTRGRGRRRAEGAGTRGGRVAAVSDEDEDNADSSADEPSADEPIADEDSSGGKESTRATRLWCLGLF